MKLRAREAQYIETSIWLTEIQSMKLTSYDETWSSFNVLSTLVFIKLIYDNNMKYVEKKYIWNGLF